MEEELVPESQGHGSGWHLGGSPPPVETPTGDIGNRELEPWELYLLENQRKAETRKTRVDPDDGLVYEWDEERKGWFPRIDEDFIAKYQASYGFTEDLKPIQVQAEPISAKEALKKQRVRKEKVEKTFEKTGKSSSKKKEPEWFEVDKEKDTHAYISGLPLDITEDELLEIMTKFGIIMEDPETNKLKVKLYKDAMGNVKGDALCCYLKPESVNLAIDMLNDTEVRGYRIKVDHAVFEIKGAYNPRLKAKKSKKKGSQARLLDWSDRGEYKKRRNLRAAVIHNLFTVEEFLDDPSAILDYKEELKQECSKFGEVKKVFVFERNPDGVCSILFTTEEAAEKCVEAMNGRICGGRTLISHIWDGFTKYEVPETEEQKEQRLQRWQKFVEERDGSSEASDDEKICKTSP